MKLIKLTNPELIEAFFNGKKSVSIEESCKILTTEDKIICDNGANVSINNGVITVNLIDAPKEEAVEETPKKKTSKKK